VADSRRFFLKLDNAIGLMSKSTDWAPELGVVWSLGREAARAILYGGLTVGVLDGLDAIVFFGLRNGVGPPRISRDRRGTARARHAVAGGGRDRAARTRPSFHHRDDRRGRLLRGQPPFPVSHATAVPVGAIYGIVVYLTMNLVVLPLSALHGTGLPTRHRAAERLLIHIIAVGTPSALFARAALGQAR